jgi:hypothetical protein
VLTFGLLFMAADELVSLHVKLIFPLRRLLRENEEVGIFFCAWAISGYGVLVVGLTLFFL